MREKGERNRLLLPFISYSERLSLIVIVSIHWTVSSNTNRTLPLSSFSLFLFFLFPSFPTEEKEEGERNSDRPSVSFEGRDYQEMREKKNETERKRKREIKKDRERERERRLF